MNIRKIKGYGRTTTTFEENGKLYVQMNLNESMSGQADFTATYVEMDKKEYIERLRKLAKEIAANPNVKVEDVIFDALRDYPLSYIEDFENAAAKEMKKKEPTIKTKPGHCCELMIGKSVSFVLRN